MLEQQLLVIQGLARYHCVEGLYHEFRVLGGEVSQVMEKRCLIDRGRRRGFGVRSSIWGGRRTLENGGLEFLQLLHSDRVRVVVAILLALLTTCWLGKRQLGDDRVLQVEEGKVWYKYAVADGRWFSHRVGFCLCR